MLFSGCTSDSYKAEVPPALLSPQELQATVTSPSFTGTAVYSILEDSTQKIEIISPDEAEGLTVLYKDGKAKFCLDTLEVESSDSYLSENSFASALCKAVERILQCTQTPAKEGDLWVFSTADSSNSCVVKITPEGMLNSFESPQNNLSIDFTVTAAAKTE